MGPRNNSGIRLLRLVDLQGDLREEILNFISGMDVALENIVVCEYDYVPMRLQEIVGSLASRGVMIIGSLVYGGRLYIIGLRGRSGGVGVLFEASRG